MKGRQPTATDMERLQRALSLVTAYDDGCSNNDFDLYSSLLEEFGESKAITDALAQFAWLLMHSMVTAGAAGSKEDILAWYGKRFADRVEELK